MAVSSYLLPFLLFLAFSNVAFSASDCAYTIYVKTGRRISGGTDSKISAKFSNVYGESMNLPNLEAWGAMGPGHNYFERGNVDVFSGTAPCLNSPICSLTLTTDGSKGQAGWYCEYVSVSATGVHGDSKKEFSVGQWLTIDEQTVIRNYCEKSLDDVNINDAAM